jgi:hypothetical protein
MLKMQEFNLPENKDSLRISELINRAGVTARLVTDKLKQFSVNYLNTTLKDGQ